MGWETYEECPHEWGHGSLKGYATVHRRRGNELRMGCRKCENRHEEESMTCGGPESVLPGGTAPLTDRYAWMMHTNAYADYVDHRRGLTGACQRLDRDSREDRLGAGRFGGSDCEEEA